MAIPPVRKPTGDIGRASWMAPAAAAIEGGWLHCPLDPPWHEVAGGPEMLPAFLQLADLSDDHIAAYATQWGHLHVCDEHVLPSTHLRYSVGGQGILPSCRTIDSAPCDVGRTPVSVWKFWSRQAQAILRIAAKLQTGDLGDHSDWEIISDEGLGAWRREMWQIAPLGPEMRMPDGQVGRPVRPDYGVSLTGNSASWLRESRESLARVVRLEMGVANERHELASALNRWMMIADVNLALQWSDGEPMVNLVGGSLFGSLAIQLMLAVSRSDSLEVCSACGNPFAAQRRPRRNQRRYCPACGHAAAVRAATQAYRDRARQGTESGTAETPKRKVKRHGKAR